MNIINIRRCDCTQVPFSRECLEYCMGKILQKANLYEMRLILNISPSVSRKVYEAYNYRTVRRRRHSNQLRMILDRTEYDYLKSKFYNLNRTQFMYFYGSPRERGQIIEKLKKINYITKSHSERNQIVEKFKKY